ncbi:hypothetical protein P8631_13475, partial [Guyparkeria sp. 1SP6A2]|nr:hypothetical protein [Guyparkeria sp. 1SP6A2]
MKHAHATPDTDAMKVASDWGIMALSLLHDDRFVTRFPPMFSRDMTIAGFDDVLFDAMQKEVARQEAHIE